MNKTIYSVSREYSWVRLLDILYIISESSGNVFLVEKIGLEIWEKLTDGWPLTEIVSSITARYRVDSLVAKNDVDLFIDQLRNSGILQKSEVHYE